LVVSCGGVCGGGVCRPVGLGLRIPSRACSSLTARGDHESLAVRCPRRALTPVEGRRPRQDREHPIRSGTLPAAGSRNDRQRSKAPDRASPDPAPIAGEAPASVAVGSSTDCPKYLLPPTPSQSRRPAGERFAAAGQEFPPARQELPAVLEELPAVRQEFKAVRQEQTGVR